LRPICLLLALAACKPDDTDPGDTDPVETDEPCEELYWYRDGDADGFGSSDLLAACEAPAGYAAASLDCNDSDASVNPGAAEICDGMDQDCDGEADGGLPTDVWYPDDDGDGFGDPMGVITDCAAPDGYVSDGTDCDDRDAAVSPDADEACNAIDDDCDTEVDEGVATAPIWYVDADDDGWGDAGSSVRACEAPSGYADRSGDCDDTLARTSPDGTETCATGADDDCDGDANEPDVPGCLALHPDADSDGLGDAASLCLCSPTAAYPVDNAYDCDDTDASVGVAGTWYADADSDGFGDAAVSSIACDAPSSYVAGTGDCDDADGSAFPGATETCENGTDEDCDGRDASCGLSGVVSMADYDAKVVGDVAGAYMGSAVASGGDADGDGTLDVLVAATGAGSGAGTAYLFSGASFTGDLVATDAIATFGPGYRSGAVGHRVAFGGDMDGDGYAEVLVSDPEVYDTFSGDGAVYVFSGAPSGSYDVRSDADAQIIGTYAYEEAGYGLDGGRDVDGDGVADVIVGAPGWPADAVWQTGGAFVFSGPVSGSLTLDDAQATLSGEGDDDDAGWSVSSAGDLDGDGVGDVVVGARYAEVSGSTYGKAYVVLGPVSGAVSLGSADAIVGGDVWGSMFGFCVAGVGDVDNDGLDDFAVGAPELDGHAYLFTTLPSGSVSASTADATLSPGDPSHRLGAALAGGDTNADGYSDVLLGAPEEDTSATDAGMVYLLLGPVSGAVDVSTDADGAWAGEADRDYGGIAVAAADVSGDALSDVLIGAWQHDGGGLTRSGAAYLFLSR
jgi:hypothetical protein